MKNATVQVQNYVKKIVLLIVNTGAGVNGFISKLIDFLFILILIILIIHIVYNKASDYLIYCLGIILIYIFYKMYNINTV